MENECLNTKVGDMIQALGKYNRCCLNDKEKKEEAQIIGKLSIDLTNFADCLDLLIEAKNSEIVLDESLIRIGKEGIETANQVLKSETLDGAQGFNKKANDFQRKVNDFLLKYLKEHETYDKECYDELNLIGKISNKTRIIDENKSKILAVRKQPLKKGVIRGRKEAIDTTSKLMEELQLDSEILVFLNKMKSGTTLEDLTDKVLDWIKQNELTKCFRLSFSSENNAFGFTH